MNVDGTAQTRLTSNEGIFNAVPFVEGGARTVRRAAGARYEPLAGRSGAGIFNPSCGGVLAQRAVPQWSFLIDRLPAPTGVTIGEGQGRVPGASSRARVT